MIHQVIVSNQNPMTIQIPENYLGKELEVIVFEKMEGSANEPPKGNIADLFGKIRLTTVESKSLDDHLNKIRNEWERDI